MRRGGQRNVALRGPHTALVQVSQNFWDRLSHLFFENKRDVLSHLPMDSRDILSHLFFENK